MIFKWFFDKNKQKGPLPFYTCFSLSNDDRCPTLKKEQKKKSVTLSLCGSLSEQVYLFHIYRLKKKEEEEQRSNLHSMRSYFPSTSRHRKSKSEIFVVALCSAGHSKEEKKYRILSIDVMKRILSNSIEMSNCVNHYRHHQLLLSVWLAFRPKWKGLWNKSRWMDRE